MTRLVLMTILTALAMLPFIGCTALVAGAAGGVGAYAYVRGEMTATERGTYDQVWEASGQAVRALEFTVKSERRDAIEGTIRAEQADGSEVTIRVERLEPTMTKIRIRVGLFGDEQVSNYILSEIRSRL